MIKRSALGAALLPICVGLVVGCQAELEPSQELATSQESIVGGTNAGGLSQPWMARINQKVGGVWQFGCGGSLIARDWLMTAAHCVTVNNGTTITNKAPADLQVVIGDYILDVTESPEQARDVTQVVVHPGYVPATEAGYGPVKEFNDIALLKLSSPVTLGNFARIVKLASENDGPGRTTTLTGWGEDEVALGVGSAPTPHLKELTHTVVNPDTTTDPEGGCKARMIAERGTLSTQRGPDPATEICMRDLTAGEGDYQSACYYDSGSPWVTTVNGCAEQIGVHTFGDFYCVSYDIATRVSAYLSWIREQGVDYVGDRVYEAETMYHATGGSHPEGWNVWDNNYISFQHVFNGGQQQMTVRAAGTNANGWPRMRVSVGGTNVYEANVTSTAWTNHTFTFTAPYGSREVQIRFLNDYNQGGLDRNLFIDKAKVKDSRTTCGSLDTIVPTLRITNTWNGGYCAEIDIRNSLGLPTTNWTVVYDTKDSTVYDSWNPSGITGQGPHTATPAPGAAQNWLRVIPPGEVRTLGFCANRPAGSTLQPEVTSAVAAY